MVMKVALYRYLRQNSYIILGDYNLITMETSKLKTSQRQSAQCCMMWWEVRLHKTKAFCVERWSNNHR